MRLMAAHINLFWKHLRWSLNVSLDDVRLIDPNLSYTWSACVQELQDNPEAKSAVEKHLTVLQMIMSTSKVILAPVWCAGGSHGSEHWTLIAVDKSRQTTTVRYYDTLEVESLWNRAAAARLLDALDPEIKLPKKCYCTLPSPLGCGFATSWYIEEEVRSLLGEGPASRGWMSEKEVRQKLHSVSKALLNEEHRMRFAEQKHDRERGCGCSCQGHQSKQVPQAVG